MIKLLGGRLEHVALQVKNVVVQAVLEVSELVTVTTHRELDTFGFAHQEHSVLGVSYHSRSTGGGVRIEAGARDAQTVVSL